MLAQLAFAVSATALVLPGAVQKPSPEPPAPQPVPATEQFSQVRTTLHEAKERRDWAEYRRAAGQLEALLNGSPQARLEVARAEVRNGNPAAAMAELTVYVGMGQASDVLEHLPEFEPLRHNADFTSLRASAARNRQPASHSTAAFRLPDAALLPEDIDYDPRSRRFFMSSVLQHRIVSTDGKGSLVEFAKAVDDWPVMALKIDSRQRLLWATEVAIESFNSVPAADRGRSAVLCYGLDTGKLIRRIEAPRPSALGDMTLDRNGDPLVSDGDHGGIYRLAAAANGVLERLDRGDFISPQTIAMAADGEHAYVPDYVRGLGLLDLKTGQVQWTPTLDRFALDGIDGLYRIGSQLLAVQNGTTPERVIRFSIGPSPASISSSHVVEKATATLGDPTHGVEVDGTFYYIANSGWDSLGDDGVVKPGSVMTPATVMKADIRD